VKLKTGKPVTVQCENVGRPTCCSWVTTLCRFPFGVAEAGMRSTEYRLVSCVMICKQLLQNA